MEERDYNEVYDNGNELTVRSNVAGAYTNTEGYKTVSVPIGNIVILSDY